MDVAPEVLHPRLTRLPAHRFASTFFFFFFSDSRRLGSICANAARFVPNRLRFWPNRADSAKIGPYQPYRVVSTGGRYGRNRPETAETAEIGLEYGWKSRNLPSFFFFFFESRHSNVFFKNILIVKIERKYK